MYWGEGVYVIGALGSLVHNLREENHTLILGLQFVHVCVSAHTCAQLA